MPSYNNADWVEINLESILEQTYDNYDVLYIDDCSTDNTNELVTKMVGTNSKFTIKRNSENQKRGYNVAPQNIGDFFDDDEEILVFVDGDDWFPYPNTLERLNNFYNKHDCWMTYGNLIVWHGGERTSEPFPQNTDFPEHIHDNNLYRRDLWRPSHLRTFKWFIYKQIKEEDQKYSKTGKYYFHAEDLATSYPCLEMCPKDKIGHLDFISYVFNECDNNVVRAQERIAIPGGEDLEPEIRSKKPYNIYHKPLSPRDLFRPNRFDLPMKYLYAKFREQKIKSDFGLIIYKEHLRLWNGFKEYNNPDKNTFEAFKNDFDNILDSIKKDGFDGNKSQIIINSDNMLLNGSHRTCSCVLHNRDANFFVGENIKDGQLDCGYQMFYDMKLEQKYLDAAAFELCRMNRNLFIVSLFPSSKWSQTGQDSRVEEILNKSGTIAYSKDVSLNSNGAFNLMRQMYYGEEWAGGRHNNWAGFRDKAGLCFNNSDLNPMRVYVVEFSNVDITQKIKLQIRDLFGIENHSLHINDTYDETIRLARVLFNKNSIHFLNNSSLAYYENFESQIDYFKRYIQGNGLDIEDYCITASSILSAYGLREGSDLDYLHRGQEIQGHPDVHSHNEYGKNRYWRPIDDIIYNPENHFYFNDVKFASLDVVKQLKTKRGEVKDDRDLVLMASVI